VYTTVATPVPTLPPTILAATHGSTPVPTPTKTCSYYSYTINGRTVSGTCCGSLTTSMSCTNGVCSQQYLCNGVRIT
jgi:hypothetical protein